MEKKDYTRTNLWRTRNRVRQLGMANFGKGSKFITLTYDDELCDFDNTNISESNKKYALFIRRLARKFKNLKYLTVLEFQKRGAVHYHILTNILYFKKIELEKLWGYGWVRINRIKHYGHIGKYITKYMMKFDGDERFDGYRRYFCSQNLARPKKLSDFQARFWLTKIREANLKPFSSFHYPSEFNGLIAVEKYNLKDLSAPESKK